MKFDITAKATGATSGEIMIYGYISDTKWDDDDVTAKDFDSALKELSGVKNLLVRVNSYGGSVFAGLAIVSMIDSAKKAGMNVTARIEGIGASMGSTIPQAANKVIMANNSMMMIHKPSAVAWGNADAMLDTAEMLDKAESQLISLYMRRFKGTEDELKDLLRGNVDGTWLTAEEALELGLCDEVDEPVEMAACASGFRMNGIVVPTAALKNAVDKIQIHETDGGEKMIYNKETDAKIKAFLDEGKAVTVNKDGDNYTVVGSEVATALLAEDAILTTEQVKDTLGEDATAEQIIDALATASKAAEAAGVSMGDLVAAVKEFSAQATAFRALVSIEKEEAIKNGVRAKGENFNAERWGKLLDNMDYAEIKAQSKEWADEAEGVFAGCYERRSIVPNDTAPHPTNPDDYKI